MASALSVYQLKPRFQARLRPAMRRLAAAGVTPNGVTIAALMGSIGVGGVIALDPSERWRWALLPIWLLARMALNAIDGMMARELHLESAVGLALNELGDVVADIALFLPLARVAPGAAWPVVWFAIAAVLAEFGGVLGIATSGARQYQGPMGKSDRALLVGLAVLVACVWPRSTMWWPALFSAAAGAAGLTCLRRVRAALP